VVAALWVTLAFVAIMGILVALYLSHRIDALYARQREHEEIVSYAVSCGWRYTEAVDDAATDGEGTVLYLSRLPGIETEAGRHERY
jgi:hypothetical protein